MQVTLRLRTARCLDDVELVRRDDLAALGLRSEYGVGGAMWFCCRSERYHSEVVREATDLADPLVVRFINATDDTKRLAFVSRLGFPLQLFAYESHNFVLGEQRTLRRLLEQAGSGDATSAIKAANAALKGAGGDRFSLEDGRMVLTVTNPMAFMFQEVAMVAANGARLATCERCGDVFLTGKLTKRRITSRFCRDLCRVSAHRANKKGA
jgi:hypothetical protein